jgi:hypothetical protein
MADASAISLDRMVRAVEKVRERLLRATAALEAAGIPYAVAGGNAVAAWVSTVDEAAVRNTRDVDIMIDRSAFDRVRGALEGEGFTYRHLAGIDVFLDGPDSNVRDAVHLIFAGEMVRSHEPAPNPSLSEAASSGPFRVLSLDALVQIKLTAFTDKDRTHLRDMIDVGLIDKTWVPKLAPQLARRLQSLLYNPDG